MELYARMFIAKFIDGWEFAVCMKMRKVMLRRLALDEKLGYSVEILGYMACAIATMACIRSFSPLLPGAMKRKRKRARRELPIVLP